MEEKDPAAASRELSSIERRIIEAEVVEAIQTCYDPEIPVNIYELGLIYGVDVAPDGGVRVRMTLTSPHCPAAQSLPPEVAAKVEGVRGVTKAVVDVVWDPPWNPGMMTEAARLQLGMI
jgi:FeS assembly SUF system protein